ncbi:GNAT family N-acetyltransferase [Lactobacillus xylocopicola]|uniref:N-acetyltransferase n=1 Tax=Lactobacillus xylocopicola TaxID=2976676 RepID=A0ABN6SID9_9LACO|nr:GNAT family protein [Lactobacillus xylocopicola]BDR60071.1 N-acetyltransferase [Lactobacillus xylocopicola]
MAIIDEAKELLKKDGSPQWQNGNPNHAILAADIVQEQAYCLMVDQAVAGVAALVAGPEPNYDRIDGAWQNTTDQYATIHRIAISGKYRGQHLSQFFLSNLLSRGLLLGIHNFRIDTHADNQRMQALISKVGFQYRGTVWVDQTADGARYAYELNL